NKMQLSYWELKTWFSNVDFTIVGSGIVGLHCALRVRERFPESKVLIIEKGALPQGASTKNAGFACFGSLSEIIDDLKIHTEEEVMQLIQKRWSGLQLLRNRLGDTQIDFRPYGGYELFLENDAAVYEECLGKLPFVNELLRPLFKSDVFSSQPDRFAFGSIRESLIFNPFEAQIDTGNMMQALLKEAVANDIVILNRQTVTAHYEHSDYVEVALDDVSFSTKHLLFATNVFAQQLTANRAKHARTQVMRP